MKRATLLSLSLLPIACAAAPPQLESVWPSGGQKGAEIELTLTGKLDPWPCELHFSREGFRFIADAEKAGTGRLTIPSEGKPGPVIVRALNPEGVSAPLIFVVGELHEILEEENDANTVAKAQPLDSSHLPVVVNGHLPKDHEIDSFRLALKKGETIHAAVEGYTIRSLIDPVLHVYDATGNRLAIAHDGDVHLDPMMEFTAPETGDYVFAVTAFAHPPAASAHFSGGKNAHYRLYLARERKQLPDHLFPPEIPVEPEKRTLSIEDTAVGNLEEEREIDVYEVSAKKDDSVLVSVAAATLGFPTDPVLRILKPDGSELRLVDDTGSERDPEYLWKVAADGTYRIEISDRFGRGGPSFRYRIRLADPVPDFAATVEKSEYVLEPSQTLEIKVNIARLHGHEQDLQFEIPGLPEKVKFTPPEKVPEKGGDITLKLEAEKDAPAFQSPLTIQVKAERTDGGEPGEPMRAVHSFQDDNYRGPYVIMELPEIWLTIPPRKETRGDTDPEEK